MADNENIEDEGTGAAEAAAADDAVEAAAADAPAAEGDAPAAEAAAAAAEAPAEEAPAKAAPKRTRAKAPAAEAADEAPRKRTPRPKAAPKAPAKKERGTYRREPREPGVQGPRKERRGVVVSSKPDKTIVVRIDSAKPHPKYHKIVRRSTKLHAHDEQNAANVGDVVRVLECRPLSRTKRWRLVEIVEVAK